MPHGLFSVVVAPARRAIALGFTAAVCLGLSGLLTACGPASSASQAPAFKGIDVTGAAYGRQLALTDMTGAGNSCVGMRRYGPSQGAGYQWILYGVSCDPRGRTMTDAQIDGFLTAASYRGS